MKNGSSGLGLVLKTLTNLLSYRDQNFKNIEHKIIILSRQFTTKVMIRLPDAQAYQVLCCFAWLHDGF